MPLFPRLRQVMSMMRAVLLPTMLLTLSCRSTKTAVELTHTRDSTTTVTAHPVELHLPADTARADYAVDAFAAAIKAAPVGAVVYHQAGKGKRVGFTITKTATPDSTGDGFHIEAIAQGKDTTIYVHDTLTVVRDNRTKTTTHTVEPSTWEKIQERVIWSVVGVVGLFLLLIVYRIEKK